MNQVIYYFATYRGTGLDRNDSPDTWGVYPIFRQITQKEIQDRLGIIIIFILTSLFVLLKKVLLATLFSKVPKTDALTLFERGPFQEHEKRGS